MSLSSSRSAIRSALPAAGTVLATGTVLAVATTLMGVLASCGASSSGGPGKGPTGNGPLSPVKAISLAASQRINSLSADVSIQSPGLSSPLTETINEQLRPTVLGDMTLNGGSLPSGIEAILTGNAIYMKDSALASLIHKPWVKISFAQISSKTGLNLGSLFQSLESSNPENQVKLFADAKNVHVIGTQTINGVPTTEYAGSYLPSVAASKLPASLRKLLGSELRLMGNTPVPFHVWIDAQHVVRKAVIDETISGQSLVTTMVVTSVNQPVNVTLPAPSQVASMP